MSPAKINRPTKKKIKMKPGQVFLEQKITPLPLPSSSMKRSDYDLFKDLAMMEERRLEEDRFARFIRSPSVGAGGTSQPPIVERHMRRGSYYVLDGRTPVVCYDFVMWAEWFEAASKTGARIVNRTMLASDTIMVSTVFLGIDHNFAFEGRGLPILFETMVFGGPLDQEMDRYSTWDSAELGHKQMVRRMRAAIGECSENGSGCDRRFRALDLEGGGDEPS